MTRPTALETVATSNRRNRIVRLSVLFDWLMDLVARMSDLGLCAADLTALLIGARAEPAASSGLDVGQENKRDRKAAK